MSWIWYGASQRYPVYSDWNICNWIWYERDKETVKEPFSFHLNRCMRTFLRKLVHTSRHTCDGDSDRCSRCFSMSSISTFITRRRRDFTVPEFRIFIHSRINSTGMLLNKPVSFLNGRVKWSGRITESSLWPHPWTSQSSELRSCTPTKLDTDTYRYVCMHVYIRMYVWICQFYGRIGKKLRYPSPSRGWMVRWGVMRRGVVGACIQRW